MGAGVTSCVLDCDAVARALENNRNHTAGIIILLAWRQGLTREELGELTWGQINFAEGLIMLPDRAIPLAAETRDLLLEWKALYGECSDRVVISEKLKKPMAPESISRLVRKALDEEGLSSVRIVDLRSDYIQSQLQQHDWARALQVSGLSVTTYRNCLAGTCRSDCPDAPEQRSRAGTEAQILEIIEKQQNTPEGIALALSFHLGLRNNEIVGLKWEQVNFETAALFLDGKPIPLDPDTLYLLQSEFARRSAADDPHIILSPLTRKPVSGSRLSTMVRTVLIRGGLQDTSLCMTRRDQPIEEEKQRIIKYVSEHGSISRSQCLALLDSTPSKVYARLNDLVFSGALIRINARYYLPESVVPPEQQRDAIVNYIAENGTAYCQDIAELLHIGKRTTARILKKLVDSGELVLLSRSKRYVLPEE